MAVLGDQRGLEVERRRLSQPRVQLPFAHRSAAPNQRPDLPANLVWLPSARVPCMMVPAAIAALADIERRAVFAVEGVNVV
jgi:hypothetical protein